MKELKFEIENHINNILIKKNNNIIYKDKIKILEFYNILQKNMRPVYDSARRQGYEIWNY